MNRMLGFTLQGCFLSLMMLLASCQEKTTDPVKADPQLSIATNSYVVDARQGQCVIPYTLQDPVEGVSLQVSSEASWIQSIEVTETSVLVNVLENSAREPRTADLKLVYAQLEKHLTLTQYEGSRRYDVFPMYQDADIPYRIPAIAQTKEGTLLCVADYRHSRADIGVVNNGRIDLHINRSYDNGVTWEGISTIIDGQGASSPDFMNVGYGDPCLVADRESSRVLLISCAGNVSYQNGSRDNHQNIARFYSEDGGMTWSDPEDIAESIYSQFDDCTQGPVQAMFVASGKILQSRFVKVGDYYRLYCAVLLRNKNGVPMNYALYSDDFGDTWKILGNPNVPPVRQYADEPKVEELPDGTLLISSRWEGGRYYNTFVFTDAEKAEGTWKVSIFSGSANDGVVAASNSTNGEVLCVPAIRVEDGASVDVLLQSVPLGPGRQRVGIYYKVLASSSDYSSPAKIASNWDGVYQVTSLNSAYSTMVLQQDGRIAFLWEETTYCLNGGGYTIAYDCYPLERLTSGKYRLAQ